MLNMIKMDLYRMFRTKSMYVVWIVLAVSVLFTTFMCETDYDSLSKEDTVQQEQFAEPTAENINVGMMVTLPTEPGEKVTVYDIFSGEILCVVSGDFCGDVFNSGYWKRLY